MRIDKEKNRTRYIKVKTIVEDWLLSIMAAALIILVLLISIAVIQLLQHDAYRVLKENSQKEIHYQNKHLVLENQYEL